MIEITLPEDPIALEEVLEAMPDKQAVYLLWPREGKPELARTNVLRRRLRRALPELKGTITRVEYQRTGSRLESQFLMLALAKTHMGAGYRDEIRLRMPPWVKLVLTNKFPRTVLTRQLAAAPAVYFGPFRNRSTAARFESEYLDLFQLRRCQEDLEPAPEHPGCIYGEMGRCLRPCQQAVGVAEYEGEAERVAEFFRSNGRSLAAPAESNRERLSAEMDFEGAALLHERCRRIEEVLSQRDEMVRELGNLNAIAVVPSAVPEAVELGWLRGGNWKGFTRLEFGLVDARAVSLDSRVREIAVAVNNDPAHNPKDRMDHLATLARWRYSNWCDGELLMVDDWSKIPYRKLVNAVSRVAGGQPQPRPNTHS